MLFILLFASLVSAVVHAKRVVHKHVVHKHAVHKRVIRKPHKKRHVAQPAVSSRAAIAVDMTSGRTLYTKNADLRVPIASLTKLMTAMVVIDSKRSLIKPARITDTDVDRLKWSRSRLPVGSLLLRRTMLSRDYPGGRSGFGRAMNCTAQRLHVPRSHFVDPTGLSPHNVSTARNLTRLARAAYRYPTIREYATSHEKLVLGGDGPLVYRNTDPLVYCASWQVGLQKTGFTNEAGHCHHHRDDGARTPDAVRAAGRARCACALQRRDDPA